MKQLKAQRSVEPPLYRYWQGLYLAFYSRPFYVDVVKRWHGLGLIYMLLLTAILSIPFSVRVVGDFSTFFSEKVLFPIKNLPPFEIKNGEVVSSSDMPHLVRNPQGDIIAAVDTSGEITMDGHYPALQLLVTKDALVYRFPPPTFFMNKTETPSTEWTVMKESFNSQMNQTFDRSCNECCFFIFLSELKSMAYSIIF